MCKFLTCLGIVLGCVFSTLPIVSADELADLKQQLNVVEQEKKILLEKIERLEADNLAKDKKIESQMMAHSTSSVEQKDYTSDVSLNYYWDSREYATFELVTSTTNLPMGFTFWGFTDLHGTQNSADDSFDFTRYFMEYRLSHAIDPDWVFDIEGLGYQLEYNDANGSGNDLVRAGITYRHDIPSFTEKNGWFEWRAFPVESDGSGELLGWAFYWPLHERVWLSGFADYNIIKGGEDRWIFEPQLNIKLTDRMNLLLEYRYNEFERSNALLDGEGLAVGLGFKF